MRAALAKTLKATAQPALRANARAVSGLLEGYGDHVFKGATAEPYLAKQGLSAATLSNSEWTKDAAMADKVAAAVAAEAQAHRSHLALGKMCIHARAHRGPQQGQSKEAAQW